MRKRWNAESYNADDHGRDKDGTDRTNIQHVPLTLRGLTALAKASALICISYTFESSALPPEVTATLKLTFSHTSGSIAIS